MLEFFAACIPGTERALCDELRELGFASVRLNRGGIPFRGEWHDGWRACLESRIAQRIYLLQGRFPAETEQALYDGVMAIDWHPYITPEHTLAVKSVTVASNLTHSGFVALKAKDAIVDQVRTGASRPSVSKDDPNARIFLHLANNKATVYLDMSGEALHRRGYRSQTGEAPLRETLAAAILRISGWDRKMPLLDPMCGSGTIAIEAAMWAANIAPGLNRARFGFERWANFNGDYAADFKALCGELRANVSGHSPKIVASDIDPMVLKLARANARAAGVRISFKERSLFDLQGDPEPRIVVSNPPYGVRLEAAPDFVRKATSTLSRLHGWRVCLLAGTPAYEKSTSQKPKWKRAIKNGDLDCEFLVYNMK